MCELIETVHMSDLYDVVQTIKSQVSVSHGPMYTDSSGVQLLVIRASCKSRPTQSLAASLRAGQLVSSPQTQPLKWPVMYLHVYSITPLGCVCLCGTGLSPY